MAFLLFSLQALKQKVDDEVKRIVDEQYQRGMTLLRVPWRLKQQRMGLPGGFDSHGFSSDIFKSQRHYPSSHNHGSGKWDVSNISFLSFSMIFHSMIMGDKVSPKNQGKLDE